MENYQIVPWAEQILSPDVVHEQYVPPELEMLARQVMEQYDMQVNEMVLITSKPDKGGAIWKIGTDKGTRSIKVLHRRPQRSLFSIGAQEYMSGLGYRVPSFIPTRDGSIYVEAGGKLWIVTEWIEPLLPVSKIDLEGAAELCFGLGEFHKNSKGYVPPYGSERSSRIYGWTKYYEKIIAKIGWFRDIAQAYPETAASESLLSVVDDFERQAIEVFEKFKLSPYTKMIAKGEPHWGLAHQDYGWSNGQMGPGGIWVIDLDGVSYDLPFRDLRKLITSTMDDMGVWDVTWIRGMIDAYHQANPIDQETFEILWLDMAFPNGFYKHVKEIVFEPLLFLQTELEPILQRVMATEASKWQVLAELEMDKSKYPAGDYTTEEITPFVFERPVLIPGNMILTDPVAIDTSSPVLEQNYNPERIASNTETPVYTPSILADNTSEIPTSVIPEKFTLRIPKRRSSPKPKRIKKLSKFKKKKQKKLIRIKPGTRKYKRGTKKSLYRKIVLFKLKKKTTKRKKGFKKTTKALRKKKSYLRRKTA